jgi:alginate O-acetyltransferase complex protein AlgI
MFFDSPVYFLFLLLVVPAYWLLRHRQQNVFLLIASYIFYGWWDYRFLGLILISTVVDFWCARWIDESSDARRRKALLILSLGVNLTFLGFFKYYNFFAESLADSLHFVGIDVSPRLLKILLPPGISFYTFQELAYIVDVYKRRLKPARSLVEYALFISLFPHLIAGPIQQPSHLLPQVQEPRTFSASKAFDGIMLIVSGLFRKCVIADTCALLANAAFGGQFGAPNAAAVLIGTYAFAWQIYGDFSGYSDIARGSAQLLGFHFMVNFRQPYLAVSLQDFWRRWHISLSTWLREYLYIPLGGNRGGEVQTQRNLILTMLIGGFWHGANWTFVIWGMLHGAGLAIERFAQRAFRKATPAGTDARVAESGMIGIWLRRVAWFHLVCLAWIFFRAESVGAAVTYLSGLAHFRWQTQYTAATLLLCALAIPMLLLDLRLEARNEEYAFEHSSVQARVLFACVAVGALLLFSANAVSAFIYFQF